MKRSRVRAKSLIVVPPYGSALLKGMVPSGAYEVIWGDCVEPGVVLGSYPTSEEANDVAVTLFKQMLDAGFCPKRVVKYQDPPIESDVWNRMRKGGEK